MNNVPVKLYFGHVTEYSKNIFSQCYLTTQIEPVHDKDKREVVCKYYIISLYIHAICIEIIMENREIMLSVNSV